MVSQKVIEEFKREFREEEGRDITDSEFEQVNNELDALVEILFQHWAKTHIRHASSSLRTEGKVQ